MNRGSRATPLMRQWPLTSGLSNSTLPIRPLLDLGNDAEDLRPLLVPAGPVPVGRMIVGYSRRFARLRLVPAGRVPVGRMIVGYSRRSSPRPRLVPAGPVPAGRMIVGYSRRRVADGLDGQFCRAVALIFARRRSVIVSGMGKAGCRAEDRGHGLGGHGREG